MTPPVRYPYGYPPPVPHRRPVRTADVVVTALLGTALAVVALLGAYFSLLFAMITDSCGVNDCNESLLLWAYLLAWGGIAVATAGALLGVLMAARRGSIMWIWPALGLVIVPAAVVGGALLAGAVVQH